MKTTLLFLTVFLSAPLFGQNVYIPDANFKTYLVGNPDINTNGDTEIQLSEATPFDGQIVCNYENIFDLTGIEAFTALTSLSCYFNQLTSLDLSQNTALYYLRCDNNELTGLDVGQNTALTHLECSSNQLISLDVSQNIALTVLNCGGNQLTGLDVSQNTALTVLGCGGYQLTSLDVSQNTALEGLYCANNQLTSLDVSQNIALTELYCFDNQLTCLNVANGNNIDFSYFITSENPNLDCVQVDNAEWSSANWTGFNGQIDPQMYFSEDCNNDCSSSASLSELTISKNLIKILDLMGRETSFKPNTPLIYVYDDGSIQKVFSVEY